MCVPLHDGTCSSIENFNSRATELAAEYSQHNGFRNQWGLGSIAADKAYANLRLLRGEDAGAGSGVTIGFIDSGIDKGHPVFAGKKVSEEFLSGAVDEAGTGRDSHGTEVASVAAALRLPDSSAAHHGVAWDADIAMFAIPTGSGSDFYYEPVTLSELYAGDSGFAAEIRRVFEWRDGERRVDILNLSVGYPGIIDDYEEQDLRDNLPEMIAAIAQTGVAETEKVIFVWNAGNAHGDDCDSFSTSTQFCEFDDRIDAVSVEVLPGLPALIEELRGHFIAAVAIEEGGEIVDFSNRCGIAADFCIAAPGQDVKVAYFGPSGGMATRSFTTSSGTSYAAPMVAGGLALIKQLFRDQLSSTELVTRLLETADSTGRYSNRDIYGHGKMDLAAATSPVGILEVPVDDMTGGAGSALRSTGIRLGPAFGDGLDRSIGGREIAAFDSLGAPFWFSLGGLASASTGPPMAARVRELMDLPLEPRFAPARGAAFAAEALWSGYRSGFGLLNAPAGGGGLGAGGRRALSFDALGGPDRLVVPDASIRLSAGFLRPPAGDWSGHLALAEDALAVAVTAGPSLSLAAFSTGGSLGRTSASGTVFSWHPTGSPLGLRAGWISEREALLGSLSEGAFGELEGDIFFAGVSADGELGGWRMGADAEIGAASPATRNGIIAGVSPLATSTFSLHASRTFANDGTLRLGVSQPLRVERGLASLVVPTGRTKTGEVIRTPVSASLVPSGRQIDFAVRWHQPLAAGELRLGIVASSSLGHRAVAETGVALLSGWRCNFRP